VLFAAAVGIERQTALLVQTGADAISALFFDGVHRHVGCVEQSVKVALSPPGLQFAFAINSGRSRRTGR
jgi:hypothetical protein